MTLIQVRRGTAAAWIVANPILAQGEIGYEIDNHNIKVGDGSTAWNSLSYFPVHWASLTGKPTVIAAAETKADARGAIDAEPVLTAGTEAQYYRGDKTWQTLDKTAAGLGNVDNTSDATKDAATSTLTNKTISGSSNTLSDIPQSAVTNLGTALSAKEDTANKSQANGYASLDANGKVPANQLPNSIMEYQGTWDASTNTPTLTNSGGAAVTGNVYRVSVAGSCDFGAGAISFNVSDYCIYNGTAWEKSDTTDAVSTVAGRTGDVVIAWSDLAASTSAAVGVGAVELGHATDTTLSRSSAGILAVEGVAVPTISSTATLTNKRVTPRIGTTASSATPSIDIDSYDQYNITALAAAITSVTVTGTPTDGQRLLVRIKDNGTARAISWGSSFIASGLYGLLATTVINKTHLVGFIYDSVATKWVCVAVDPVGY